MYREEQRERRRRRLIETFSPEKLLTKNYRSRTKFLGIAIRGLGCALGPVLIFLFTPRIRRTSSFFKSAKEFGKEWVKQRWEEHVQVIEVPNHVGKSRFQYCANVYSHLCYSVFKIPRDSYDAIVFTEEFKLANYIVADKPTFLNEILKTPLYEAEVLNMYADIIYNERMQEVKDYYRDKHNFHITNFTLQLYDMLYRAFGPSKHMKLLYLDKAVYRNNMKEFKHTIHLAFNQVLEKYRYKYSVDDVISNCLEELRGNVNRAIDIMKKHDIIKKCNKICKIFIEDNKWLFFMGVIINPIMRYKFVPIFIERRSCAYSRRTITSEDAARIVAGVHESGDP